jgi:hypothetical protein
MGLIFQLTVLVSEALSLTFLGFCLLMGTQTLCSLAEDFPRLAKRTVQVLTGIVLLFHLVLFLFDHMPVVPVMVGCVSHGTYYLITLRKEFPVYRTSRPVIVVSVILFLVSNAVWARELWHFYDPWVFSESGEGNSETWREGLLARNTFSSASFMLLCVWLLPLCLLLVVQDGKSFSNKSLPTTRVTDSGASATLSRPRGTV